MLGSWFLYINVTMKLSNVIKKIKVPPNVKKVQSNMMLVLPNVAIKPSNVGKKKGNHQM